MDLAEAVKGREHNLVQVAVVKQVCLEVQCVIQDISHAVVHRVPVQGGEVKAVGEQRQSKRHKLEHLCQEATEQRRRRGGWGASDGQRQRLGEQ